MVDFVRQAVADITKTSDEAEKRAISNRVYVDKEGQQHSVLALAASIGLPDAIAILGAAGANPNPEHGTPPLALAALLSQQVEKHENWGAGVATRECQNFCVRGGFKKFRSVRF